MREDTEGFIFAFIAFAAGATQEVSFIGFVIHNGLIVPRPKEGNTRGL